MLTSNAFDSPHKISCWRSSLNWVPPEKYGAILQQDLPGPLSLSQCEKQPSKPFTIRRIQAQKQHRSCSQLVTFGPMYERTFVNGARSAWNASAPRSPSTIMLRLDPSPTPTLALTPCILVSSDHYPRAKDVPTFLLWLIVFLVGPKPFP